MNSSTQLAMKADAGLAIGKSAEEVNPVT